MALKRCYYQSKKFTLATTAGWKTLLTLAAPANHPLDLRNWAIKPLGINNTDEHVEARLVKVTDAGTGSSDVSSSIFVVNRPEAALSTVMEGDNADGFTTSPTSATPGVVRHMPWHPQSPGDLPSIDRGERIIPGGETWAVQVDNEGGAAVDCTVDVEWEE